MLGTGYYLYMRIRFNLRGLFGSFPEDLIGSDRIVF